MIPYNSIFSDESYYLSIPNALVNCPPPVLIILLMFNIIAIYKDWTPIIGALKIIWSFNKNYLKLVKLQFRQSIH